MAHVNLCYTIKCYHAKFAIHANNNRFIRGGRGGGSNEMEGTHLFPLLCSRYPETPQCPLTYLLFILAEKIDASRATESQACREEPGTEMDPIMPQRLRDGQHLPLGLL